MSLKFECPHCDARLSAEPELYHTEIDCPTCAHTFVVPTPEDLGHPAEEKIKFLCPGCGRKLSATEAQFGTEMPCPFTDCEKPVIVPRPEWKPVPTTRLKKNPGS